MNKHVASTASGADPSPLVQEMAYQLYAGILGGLNTSRDQDVIKYLWDAPQRYGRQLILDHYQRALIEAKHMLNEAAISQPTNAEMSNG
jgi:hypothetical protein